MPEPTITPPPLARHHSRHGDRETEGIIGYAIQELSPSPASTSTTLCGAHSVVESIPIDAVHHNNSVTEPPSLAYYPDDPYDHAIGVRSPTEMHMRLPFIVDDDETTGLQNIAQKELVCITAQNIERYDMGIRIKKGAGFSVIPALKRQFTHETLIHPSWTRHVHPDGQPYYYNTPHAEPRLRYVTLADLLNTSVLTEIQLFVDHMHDLINRHVGRSSFTPSGPGNGNGPGDGDGDGDGDGIDADAAATGREEVEVEVFLQLSTDGTWGYYIVDHRNRCLFWLEDIDVETGIWEIGGKVMTFAHMQHYITYEYWCHCEWFPHDKTITREELDELAAFLAYGIIDTMTWMDSTISYSTEDLTTMLQVFNEMRNLNEKTVPVNAAAANERLLNFHGIHGARLTSEQSVQGGTGDHSLLVTILSPLLFCAPDEHLKGLEKIWVDGMIKQLHWKLFIETLKKDWMDYILYMDAKQGTVLLSVDVAFLSIPSVNEAAQIANLLSAACSGLFEQSDASTAWLGDVGDHVQLAICSRHIGKRNVFQFTVIGVTWLFIGVLIAWTIHTVWEYRPSRLRRFVHDRVMDLTRLLGVHRDDAYPDDLLSSANQPYPPSTHNLSTTHLPTSSLSSPPGSSSIVGRAWKRMVLRGGRLTKLAERTVFVQAV
ncbi:hypothetical protein BD410DRAFT_806289 [Rickenella mellea]|uniref:Uncharacterized protein n=1 Tax=Rickenella mellea TaxID=50990 RepID=A0A4Y7PUN6_9AGAM|nr:hypothetical protein BD410DRAFT_806289 [Rickenella mellea]